MGSSQSKSTRYTDATSNTLNWTGHDQVSAPETSTSFLSWDGFGPVSVPEDAKPSPSFLNWDGLNVESNNAYTPIFLSLVKMLEEGNVLDEDQQLKAANLLKILHSSQPIPIDNLSAHLFPHSEDKDKVFLDHIWIVIQCQYSIIVTEGLLLLTKWFHNSPPDVMFSFNKEGGITRLLI